MSGTPPAKTCFGLVSFNAYTKEAILGEFFKKYSQYEGKKGRELNNQDFINIVQFFDKKKVKMVVFNRSNNDWVYYKKTYGTQHAYLEKICGVIYMFLLRRVVWAGEKYTVTSCVETQWGDIHRVFHHCKRIINIGHSNIQFTFNHSYDYDNPGVKIADFIAASARFFKPKHLEDLKIKNYHIIKIRPPKWYFRVVFT